MILREITNSILSTLETTFQAKSKSIIAVDGVDASGKTTFVKQLQVELEKQQYTCAVVSLDDFHNAKKIRYQKGDHSALGFYEDSYNYEVFISETVLPFKEGKDKIKVKHFNLELDKREIVYEDIGNCNLLIVEGIFANRKELHSFWDYSIFLDITFEEGLKRNIIRDNKEKTKEQINAITTKFNSRYKAGQEIYLALEKPKEKVNMIIHNNDFNDQKYSTR